MRIVILTITLMLLASVTRCQTVSPILVEFGHGKASGEFRVINNSVSQLVAEVTPMSLYAANGKPAYRPLDPGVSVQLSETSAKLGPRQTHAFGYKVRCEHCAVVFVSSIHPPLGKTGLAIDYRLPHVVYVCQQQKHCRINTRAAWGLQ